LVDEDLAALGRQVTTDGSLIALRQRLGLTMSAMAELLNTSIAVYKGWEQEQPRARMWDSTAERVGRFYTYATRQLDLLNSQGVEIGELMPFFAAAASLGIPQEVLLKRYREGLFHAEDLGMVGLWIHKVDLPLLRERV
jgi:transcriptional regulator with XRE-family HTH domain